MGEREKWRREDGFYHCWFCEKPLLTEDEVFWVGNIERPVCKDHKNSYAELLETEEEE